MLSAECVRLHTTASLIVMVVQVSGVQITVECREEAPLLLTQERMRYEMRGAATKDAKSTSHTTRKRKM